ncbi:MAG: T9SS type A sorting domain-containing protein [Bacteroidetes bacterium]|nr:T9SS type A sorting domain-containing protein [Bacteroidota bacterium]
MNVHLPLVPLAALLVTALPLQAQERCGATQARHRLIAQDPRIVQQEADYEHGLQEYLQVRAGLRDDDDTTVYHIPLVFHILHDPENAPNDNQNISDEQIYNQVNILNRDYRKLNADVNNATNGFGAIAADTRIDFQLATKDPYGNCTNGIDRITTLRTNEAANWSKVNGWFRDRYVNVWVVKTIGDAGVAGNAYNPPDVQQGSGAMIDGILILYQHIGAIEQGSPYNSRSLTHEVGHFLNLAHPWGNTNDPGVACGDDGVADTPITMGYDLFCPLPQNTDVCVPGVFENYQNYMDYSYCSVMFTEGQKQRMRASLNNQASGRNNLWKETNHQNTGIHGYELTCGPEADFYSLNPFVCAGEPVRFRDNSRRATPTSWAWSFEGGSPATSNERDPVVTFAEGGYHNVTLTVGNEHGSSSRTRNDQAIVAPDYPEVQGLLNEPFPNWDASSKWPAVNYENNMSAWSWNANAGHNEPGCMWLNASQTYTLVIDQFSNPEDGALIDKDVLISPVMDLSHTSGMQLSFWYAYATSTSDMDMVRESLKVYSSTDCGATWLSRKTLQGADLVTAGVASPGYTPLPGDWRQVTITIPSTVQRDHVRFKFEYNSSGFSNDLYLDDINLSGTVGIDDVAQSGTIDLMPNPTRDHVTITLDMAGSNKGNLSFLDMTGRTVYAQAISAGQQRLDLDLAALGFTNGVYLVQLDHEKGKRVERLVVQ